MKGVGVPREGVQHLARVHTHTHAHTHTGEEGQLLVVVWPVSTKSSVAADHFLDFSYEFVP